MARRHKLFWGSSYDRGLDILLFMWDDIIKKHPKAELHICYGWDLFIKAAGNNPERMKWKESVDAMMGQKGIVHHGRVGKSELGRIRKSCGIWAYPTYFTEINCITALECQRDGVVPVVVNLAALEETVGSGIKVDGYIRDREVMERFRDELLGIMGDKKRWNTESKKAVSFAGSYGWESIAKDWDAVFKQPHKEATFTIITPTIRRGFWNLMAHNISIQDYDLDKVEWVVVDGYKDDRSEIMREVCERHGIKNYQYLRDPKPKVKRRYNWIHANNLAYKKATGDVLVWLQDFVLMPSNALRHFNADYSHNPNALVAPTDKYYKPLVNLNLDSEDWFNGEVNIPLKELWSNIRNDVKGRRRSTDPFDFEMNFGMIPKHIVEKLNGFWEFLGDGFGYDNTDIAFRALEIGCDLYIDSDTVAVCIDHWEPLEGSDENVKAREHNLNDARFLWMCDEIIAGRLPVVRDQGIDDSISLPQTIPAELSKDEAAQWIKDNARPIVDEWGVYGNGME